MSNEAKMRSSLTKIKEAAKRARDARNPVAKANIIGQILFEADYVLRETSGD